MEKISIIIPVYNAEKYLNKCLDSVINQTMSDIQIIILNDGSNDSSYHIIKKYLFDNRIVYIDKQNTGVGNTRNIGIEKATGEYLVFLDSDDYLEINFCEEMYKKAKTNQSDIVVCDYYEIINDTKKEILFKDFEPTNLIKKPDLLFDINLGPCNKIYQKSLFQDKNVRFAEGLKYEDMPFVVKAVFAAKKVSKLNMSLHNYIIHEKSETTTHDVRIFDILHILEITYKYLNKKGYPHDLLVYFIFRTLIDYIVRLRNYEDSKMRNVFFVKAYSLMNKIDPKWKNNHNLKQVPILKRLIVTNKLLITLYCNMYYKIKIKKG